MKNIMRVIPAIMYAIMLTTQTSQMTSSRRNLVLWMSRWCSNKELRHH